MIKYLTIAFALSLATPAASAIECRTEMPSPTSQYWSWRIIDGKRCWYPGRRGMSKSSLHWPKATDPTTGQGSTAPDALNEPDARPSAPLSPPRPNPSEAPQPNGELTFKERWPF